MIYFSTILKRGLNNKPWISEVYLLHPDGHKDILYKNDYESIISRDEILEQINDALNELNIDPTISLEEALKNMKITTYDANGDMKANTNSLSMGILKTINNENKDKLQELTKIENNINLARQKKQEIINMNYQDYKSDTNYKNEIIKVHNQCLAYANSMGIQFWRSYDDSNIYYRKNSFSKEKKYNKNDDLYGLFYAHVNIYKTIKDVQLLNNSLLLISDYLSIVKNSIFDPYNAIEWVIYNNMEYKNTFQYTSFLKKRFLSTQLQRLEQPIQQLQLYHIEQQEIQLTNPFRSIQNESIPYQPPYMQLNTTNSIIQDFIFYFSKDEYQFHYIMNWLANLFQNLNKQNMALVLIGDNETTSILINNILKPIFTYKKEYFSVITDDTLKKPTYTLIKDKIFYHIDTDKLTPVNIKSSQLSKLLIELIKPNSLNFIHATELNETYIYGETIVTSSNESPYPFLKNSYSRCSVFKVKHLNFRT